MEFLLRRCEARRAEAIHGLRRLHIYRIFSALKLLRTSQSSQRRLCGHLCFALALAGPLAFSVPPPDTQELLKVSDRSRGGLDAGVTWESEIASIEDGEKNVRQFTIKVLGGDALAIATAPARNKGEVFLFNDKTMWFSRPGLRKPVGISSRQKLSGQAANGDIANTRYSRDYEAKVAGEDVIGKEKAFRLELKAKTKEVTYDQVRYWIGTQSKLALKAEFLSLEGALLKTAHFEYGNTIEDNGQRRPFVSRMTIVDAKNPANKSTIDYRSPKKASLSGTLFNVNNLGR